jgi:hypothetical protein
MITITSRSRVLGVGLLAAALTALGASDAWAQGNPNPGVAPPGSTPHGASYPEWAGKWWTWAFSVPAEVNPNVDPTGNFFGEGQSGSVYFLPGNFGGPPDVRTVTLPAGKALLILGASVAGVLGVDAPTEAELQTGVEQAYAGVANVEVEVDGEFLQDLGSYTVLSPLFNFTLPENNIAGLPAGEYQGIAEGIFLLLEPLPVGQHVIHVHNEFPAFSVITDVTTMITVSPHR